MILEIDEYFCSDESSFREGDIVTIRGFPASDIWQVVSIYVRMAPKWYFEAKIKPVMGNHSDYLSELFNVDYLLVAPESLRRITPLQLLARQADHDATRREQGPTEEQ